MNHVRRSIRQKDTRSVCNVPWSEFRASVCEVWVCSEEEFITSVGLNYFNV
jgi:hypothetical protein